MSDKKIEFPATLKYTESHEWLKPEANNIAKVGISSFAISALGDLTFLQFDAEVGDKLSKGETFGDIESVKTTSELYMPVSGEIVAINKDLEDTDNLEKLAKDPFNFGWMLQIKMTEPQEANSLMGVEKYTDHVAKEKHHH